MVDMGFELRCAECGNDLDSEWDYDQILRVKPCESKYCVIVKMREELNRECRRLDWMLVEHDRVELVTYDRAGIDEELGNKLHGY